VSASRGRVWPVILTTAIVVLALTSSYIHFTLGEPIFLLNAAGYVVLVVAYVVAAVSSHPLVVRFNWLPRVALLGYAMASIVAWLIMGGFYTLGYITKAIEFALIALLVVDIYRVYGGPRGLTSQAVASVRDTVTSIRG
jgi:hypothetical protein